MKTGSLHLGGGLRGEVCIRVIRDDVRSLARVRALLTPADIRAARRFGHRARRRAFLINCALLRALVAELTGRDPARVRLRMQQNRRPLHLDAGIRRLALSTSHAGGWVAVAAARGAGAGRRIGLDLEDGRRRLRPGLMQRMPWRTQDAESGAITAWCLTEAALKADARGLPALDRLRAQGASPGSGGALRIDDRSPGRIIAMRLSGLPARLTGAVATASSLGPVSSRNRSEGQDPRR